MGLTVREVKEMIDRADAAELKVLERSLAADQRQGVKSALRARRKRIDALEAEQARVEALYRFDEEHRRGAGPLVGLDEVGRGAIAGPLAVGAVVLPPEPRLLGIDDSKKLSAARREELAAAVKEAAAGYAVFYVEPSEIDRIGMSAALRRAFAGALAEVERAVGGISTVLVDGNPLGLDPREVNVVKGDSLSASIAAASIVAKVTRDALMRELDSTYPGYGFSTNKGYGSKEHQDAVKSLGLSDVHRESFCGFYFQGSLF